MIAGMSETTAAAVSRNVWVLGQLRGYNSKQELADAMKWDRSRLSRTLRGDRQWTLDDLETAAKVLGLRNPGELFRPLGELVNAIAPTGTGSVTGTQRSTDQYLVGSRHPLDQDPHVTAVVLPFRRRSATVTQPAAYEWRNHHVAG